jgi:hypothetical protein
MIAAFATKIAPENYEKMKPQAAFGIHGNRRRQRNGWLRILDMIDAGSGRVLDFEMIQKAKASGHGNC